MVYATNARLKEKKMTKKLSDSLCIFFLILVVGVMPVFTFGYAAAHTHQKNFTGETDGGIRLGIGLISAISWPLYWSWELQDKINDR
jgi:hypothetical protein